jgi:soluble lytic murein transglycosylase-like protein
MTRGILITSFVLLAGAARVAAGTFYSCQKRGEEQPTVVNERVVDKWRAEGFQCRTIFRQGGAAASSDGAVGAMPVKKPDASPAPGVAAGSPDADRVREVLPLVRTAAEKYTLPVAFLLAVIKVESGFQRTAVSPAGAQGLMQVMPFNCHRLGIDDPFDPGQNILGGARLLRQLANRFEGDFVQVLSGYHAGGGAVDAKAGIPYEETNLYVKKVLDYYYHYKEFYADR